MNALQPLDTDTIQLQKQIGSSRDRKIKAKSNYQHQNRQALTVEITVKLALSWVVAGFALTSLVRLLPYHLSQQAKLQEVSTTVKETEQRVNLLRDEFNRNFDPQQTVSLMQEYSSRLAPNQSRVFWKEPK